MDYLFLLYFINPPDLPEHCDGFGTAFFIFHALKCKKGGLITACHKELCDGVADLGSKALTPTHVRDNTKSYTCCAVNGGKYNINGSPSKDEGELKGDLLIRDIWTQGTDNINYMLVVNTDITSY